MGVGAAALAALIIVVWFVIVFVALSLAMESPGCGFPILAVIAFLTLWAVMA